MARNRFKRGTYKLRCDLSGMIISSDDARKMWNGLIVHKSLWMPRHPQDRIKITEHEPVPRNPRPEGPLEFIYPYDLTNVVTVNGVPVTVDGIPVRNTP